MKKKGAAYRVLTLMLCVILAIGIMPSAHAAGTTAVKSNQPIYIDGWSWRMTAYNIGGNNYVRLRDVAEAVGFEVAYDAADGSIHISTTEPYSGDAAAMGETPESAEVAETRLTVFVDGQAQILTAYNIGGNNYTKLRDVGAAVNFSVEWDAERNRVLIDTAKPYTPEDAKEEPGTPDAPPAVADIPGGTVIDYSLAANPVIFDYFTREKYNQDRQRVLDTGTSVYWGTSLDPQSAAALEAFNKLIESLGSVSDIEKVYIINDFLCAHLTYKAGVAFVSDDFWTGTAYGMCEQYARMFQYICYRAGLPCDFIRGGRLPASPTGRHGWNEVYIDGKWQFYDGTLSDSRKTIILSDTAESANTGYTYTDDSPMATMYSKEVLVPSSTK